MNAALRKWKTCDRKRAYPTREAAFQKGQEVYQCRYCHQFHRTAGVANSSPNFENFPRIQRLPR